MQIVNGKVVHTDNPTFEQQLFSWEDWDDIDDVTFMFYDVRLKVDIGQHKAGTHFASAAVNWQYGELELKDSAGAIYYYDLKLTVVDDLKAFSLPGKNNES